MKVFRKEHEAIREARWHRGNIILCIITVLDRIYIVLPGTFFYSVYEKCTAGTGNEIDGRIYKSE